MGSVAICATWGGLKRQSDTSEGSLTLKRLNYGHGGLQWRHCVLGNEMGVIAFVPTTESLHQIGTYLGLPRFWIVHRSWREVLHCTVCQVSKSRCTMWPPLRLVMTKGGE